MPEINEVPHSHSARADPTSSFINAAGPSPVGSSRLHCASLPIATMQLQKPCLQSTPPFYWGTQSTPGRKGRRLHVFFLSICRYPIPPIPPTHTRCKTRHRRLGFVLKLLFLPGRDRAENMSWELPVLTTLILSVLGLWWVHNPHSSFQRAFFYALVGLTLLLDPRRILLHMSVSPATLDELREFRLHVLLVGHFKMVLTLGAVVWSVLSLPAFVLLSLKFVSFLQAIAPLMADAVEARP